MKRKKVVIVFAVICICLIIAYFSSMAYLKKENFISEIITPSFKVEKAVINHDQDHDSILDMDDILNGAKSELKRSPKYISNYYAGGYPPETEGVCTDVIWRAFRDSGYDLKSAIDKDINKKPKDYPRVINSDSGKPDPNIDFRRVPNVHVFLKKYAQNLPLEVIPQDSENLYAWQAGDIVVVEKGEHIAIISDKRRNDGIPYVIHNEFSKPSEDDKLLRYHENNRIIGHFRINSTIANMCK